MKSLIKILLFVVYGNLFAQDWNQLQLPDETKHAEDLFSITRPALSLRGWDKSKTVTQTTYFTPLWQSGTHEVQFDASRLASGMYFARTQILESGKAVQTQVTKLMLIK